MFVELLFTLLQIVEIRCGVHHGVYPARNAARSKHHTWHPPPEPLNASSAAIPAPTLNGTPNGTANGTANGPANGTANGSGTTQNGTGTEANGEGDPVSKGVENDATPGENETLPKGVEIEPTRIRIQLTDSATLLEKPQMPAGVKLALSFDDESQPIYSEMKRAKIMSKSM